MECSKDKSSYGKNQPSTLANEFYNFYIDFSKNVL